MVVARCAVTPPHQSRPRRGACTFITLKARGLEFFQKTRNDVACSTNKRLELEQSDLAVVGNRPRLGVHVHPVVWGGGVTARLAKVHVHTPPRPRIVRRGGGA